jgi:hypothetical protein
MAWFKILLAVIKIYVYTATCLGKFAWLTEGFCVRWLDLLHLYTQIVTTNNYSTIADLHSLTVTEAHIKSSLHSLNPFLQFLNHLRQPTPETPSVPLLSCLRASLYSLGAAPTENAALSNVACWFTAAEMCSPHRSLAASVARTT